MRSLEESDSLVVLTLENLTELHPKLVSNPRIATVKVPMPRLEERYALLRHLDPQLSEDDAARLADVTAGLKLIQIKAILSPESSTSEHDRDERRRYILALLTAGQKDSPGKDTLARADKLAEMTQGMNKEAIKKLIAPDGNIVEPAKDQRAEIDRLVAARKREIIERECMGLIEFVEPQHGFEVVGGMEEVKKDLLAVAENMRAGRRNRCPMGILFTGPMGTGKTFVAEAFAKECGLTAIKLKNFRSKWVGATEGNLERILSVIRAIGQIIVIIDEGDRAFGNTGDGDGDGGTSSRVIARIKEFMSDTENRGRVLFLLMTNRPDKLDVDIKRAGRFDRKIPFLYPQSAEEVERIVKAQLKKHKVKHALEFPRDRVKLERLVGYSNADLEAVVMLANDYALDAGDTAPVTGAELDRAVVDYMPARDLLMLELMELLAVFEASNRRMLPKKYADVSLDELQQRLGALKAQVGNRR
jgi:transitional endoplasmic reticulum ATPase